MSKWISVKEKLPKPFETILLLENRRNKRNVLVGFMSPHEAFYEPVLIDFSTERLELNGIGPARVQFWMPLPNPPTEEKPNE